MHLLPPSLITARRRRGLLGFTLIELLITVAIIGTLAALIVPAVKVAISSSLRAKCSGNLRQIGVAQLNYSNDNNGDIVPAFWVDEGAGSQYNWTGILAPYLGRTKEGNFQSAAEMPVYACPENPKSFGYGLNYLYLGWPTQGIGPKRLQVAKQSETVLITDSIHAGTDGSFNAWRPYVRPPSLGWLNDFVVDFRHPGKTANVLWLDGHVTSEKAERLMADDGLWGID